jgi:hypothetical protein
MLQDSGSHECEAEGGAAAQPDVTSQLEQLSNATANTHQSNEATGDHQNHRRVATIEGKRYEIFVND